MFDILFLGLTAAGVAIVGLTVALIFWLTRD